VENVSKNVYEKFRCAPLHIKKASGDVGSGVADHDPQNLWNPQKKLRIFRRRYIVRILTNKANISI